MNGVIVINKEKGYTSFDVVACLRRILSMKKIGHTGTLDPDAVGVLPVCVGVATKAVELLTGADQPGGCNGRGYSKYGKKVSGENFTDSAYVFCH